MTATKAATFLAALLCSVQCTVAAAPAFDGANTYGQGVHAYFSGQLGRARDLLSLAIQSDDRDPRAFYFRGLTNLQLGRDADARQDFARGAQLETTDATNFYAVSKSLERVQGRPRTTLERYRTDARNQAQADIERRRFERYERIRTAEARVLLRDDDDTIGEKSVQGVTLIESDDSGAPPREAEGLSASDAESDEPAADAPDATIPEGASLPPAAIGRALSRLPARLFGGLFDSAQDALPESIIPFGGPQPEMPLDGDAPFGDARPDGADPFGAPPAAGDNPFDAPPAEGDDPFGGAPTAPPSSAPPSADPFDDTAPATPPASDPAEDPFGS